MTVPRPTAGFSLVELAVVLVIVGLLTSGIMVSLSAQQDLRHVSDTQRQLNDIREALLGFAAAYGRLPCAATPTIASGQAGAGKEVATLGEGVLPWADLGLPETDAWGHRYTYRVKPQWCDPPPAPSQSSFTLADTGNITVSDGATDIAIQLPVIVVSHGRNGRGSYQPNGIQVAGAAGDEAENADGNSTFISHPATGTGSGNEFDDLTTWLPQAILLNRMVAVGKLP